jgi:hypothetical protein
LIYQPLNRIIEGNDMACRVPPIIRLITQQSTQRDSQEPYLIGRPP